MTVRRALRRLGLAAGVLGALSVSLSACSGAASYAPKRVAVPADSAVQIFYYPWYGSPGFDVGSPGSSPQGWRHWQSRGHAPPDDINARYFPWLGPYSSTDPAVLDQHMAWIADAHVGVIIVSWWGRDSFEDRLMPQVLEAAARHGLKVAFHIEPYRGRTVASVIDDIAYLDAAYGDEPAFLRVDRPTRFDPAATPRGVFYVYNAWQAGDAANWRDALDGIRGGPHDAFVLVQDYVFNPITRLHADGVYTYDVLTRSGSGFAAWASRIEGTGGVYAPSVGPGFDRTRAQGPNTRTMGRSSGGRYDAMWTSALASGASWITITSFNEWHEGTQIEPAVPRSVDGIHYPSYAGAYGADAESAPWVYLQRTRTWADRFDEALALRAASAVVASAPTR